ncbi:MAG: hypothetical protein ACXWZK_00135 [Solirubrobacterales bacterium]
MSFGDYATGVIGLAAIAIPLAHAGSALRGRLLPGWSGAPALLADAVLALSLLTILLQLLGAVGLFHAIPIVLASLALGAAARFALPPAPGEGAAPPAPAVPRAQLLVALVAAAFVAAHWATGLQDVWARGMLTFDTLWYHGPFAARIADTGSVWALHFTDPLYLNWFYPQNSELLHGAGIALFDRDVFSPLVNFGWLGVSLLAAWCIGRPYGVAPLSMLAALLVLDTGPMVPREAGTPANDVAPVALLLAAAAILINAWAAGRGAGGRSVTGAGPPERDPGPARSLGVPAGAAILLAGLAIGLALGTKLTVAGAAVAFAVGVPLLMPPGMRLRALGLFLGGVALTSGFWFLRNLIHSGNPLPWIGEIGPLDLPGPDRGLEGRDDFTVAHYIFENPDGDVWSFFRRSIEDLFGPAWFLLLALAAAGAVLALVRPRSGAVRVAGAVAIAGGIFYLFTPLTAAGPEGDPRAFGINLRYLVPALALGLALLPLEPKLTPVRLRLPLLAGGVAALLATSLYSDSAYIWDEAYSSIPIAALIGVVIVGGPVGIALLARRSPMQAAAAGAACALAVAAVGWERADDYLDARYTHAEDFRFQLDELAAWAKDTSGLDIGVAGLSGAYSQYVLYGDRLDNRVQFIGRELDAGDFRSLGSADDGEGGEEGSCSAFIAAVNAGGYDYVATSSRLDLNAPDTDEPSPEAGWLRRAGGAEEELAVGRVAVFRIEGELDPADCAAPEAGAAGSAENPGT